MSLSFTLIAGHHTNLKKKLTAGIGRRSRVGANTASGASRRNARAIVLDTRFIIRPNRGSAVSTVSCMEKEMVSIISSEHHHRKHEQVHIPQDAPE